MTSAATSGKVAVALLVLVSGSALSGCNAAKTLRAPVVRALPTNWGEADLEFQSRIHARYPVGSSAAAMEASLIDQGFKSRGQARPDGFSYYLSLNNFVCNMGARVFGTRDEQGRITTLDARYGEEGCL